ncbi:MAG TPA: hypothetical protein VH008_28885 [Pseudonocardia sp.]|nr:hypothetical protein [Pseudonocardia sp.]
MLSGPVLSGPVLGGLLVAAGMGAPSLFLLTGVASLGAAVFALGRVRAARPAPAGLRRSASSIPVAESK